MKKCIALIAFLLLSGMTDLSAKRPINVVSPYQYGHRWYISLQGGPSRGFYENMKSYTDYGRFWQAFSFFGALSVGYHFNDALDFRLSGSYGYNAGAASPTNNFYPYTFHAAEAFADLLFNPNALGENNTPLSPKFYLGLGGAFTHRFSDPGHPYEVLSQKNLCPGVRAGTMLEYDFESGFGLFADLCAEVFSDWYDGLEPDPQKLRLDTNLRLSFGMIYHFPLPRRQ